MKGATVTLVSIALALGVVVNTEYNWNHYLQYHAKKAARYVAYGKESAIPVPLEEEGIMYSYTTLDDYELYSWVRDHTPFDSLIVVDKTIKYPRYVFEPGAFSERHVYSPGAENDYTWMSDTEEAASGEKTIASAFGGSAEALKRLKQRGISYLVFTGGKCGALENSPLVELVFSNSGGEVFRLL